MTRRRLLIGFGLALLLLLLGYLAAWFAVPGEMRTFNRIEPGMTLSEVESVIGLPPGDYRSLEQGLKIWTLDDNLAADVRRWRWDNHSIWVAFNWEGKVALKGIDPPRPSFLDTA